MQLERYIDELSKDIAIDEFALKECQMKLPALKHKWVGRLVRHKRDLYKLQKQRQECITKISDKVRSSSEIQLTRPAANKIAEKHNDIQVLDDNIKDIELVIELLDKCERIFSSMSFDMKNLVEIIKMETL
ncbi:hypothetical protein N9033_00195 [bacterium]|nr:hypothetical protein [bacterium]